ncbi:MAG: exo-alpha-sialidase, partial [Thermoguttaceae bacterium]|nr:exo-alpha-sialidase [Thermoguttaceae bacterium]
MFFFSKSVFQTLIAVSAAFAFLTGAGAADPAPWPWMPKELVLHIATGENNPRNSEGDFIILDDGTILHIYTHYLGTSSHDDATACLMSRSSTDGGNTWTSEDRLELENEGKLNVMSVTLRRFADGRIAMFYLVKEEANDCRPYMRLRNDDGTWGERTCLIDDRVFNVVNNDRVIQLSGGRILVPVARHAFRGEGGAGFEQNAKAYCLISDDAGKSWRQGEAA